MPTNFCTWAAVEAKLSRAGAALRVDDWPAPAKADVLDEATSHVLLYTGLYYHESALVQSRWVKQATAVVACYFASIRRGNPAPKPIQDGFERVTEQLEKVQKLELRIPDAAMKKGFAPVLSNQRVQQWPVSEVKTVRGKSTGQPEDYTPHRDNYDPISYSI
jgi:hypothetical protein